MKLGQPPRDVHIKPVGEDLKSPQMRLFAVEVQGEPSCTFTLQVSTSTACMPFVEKRLEQWCKKVSPLPEKGTTVYIDSTELRDFRYNPI
jgi:hypothetical protein